MFQNDLPPFNERVPYVAAVVELEEGPRVMTNIEGTPHEELRVGMPVTVDFKSLNDEIAYSDRVSTLLILAVVFTLVALSYASLTAGAMVLMTLIAAGVVSFLYIGLKGVGININTLPVTAVGMGIGVDYILYVVDRIKRE